MNCDRPHGHRWLPKPVTLRSASCTMYPQSKKAGYGPVHEALKLPSSYILNLMCAAYQ